MKSPIKELSSQPLIDLSHINGIHHGSDALFTSSSLLAREISLVRKQQASRIHHGQEHFHILDTQWNCSRQVATAKKNVSFSSAVITILYSNDQSDESIETSLLWYSASDFQRFRADSYSIAAEAAGDVDYQHFFLGSVYSKAATMSSSAINDCTSLSPSVNYAPHNGLYANSSSNNYMAITIDTFIDLCMISKYRGLERIIFRNLVQPSRLSYIDDCIQYHKPNGRLDQRVLDGSFRQYTVASLIVSQYLGIIDCVIAQEQIRNELQHDQLPFLASQPVSLSFPAIASMQLLKQAMDNKHRVSQRRRCFMEL